MFFVIVELDLVGGLVNIDEVVSTIGQTNGRSIGIVKVGTAVGDLVPIAQTVTGIELDGLVNHISINVLASSRIK